RAPAHGRRLRLGRPAPSPPVPVPVPVPVRFGNRASAHGARGAETHSPQAEALKSCCIATKTVDRGRRRGQLRPPPQLLRRTREHAMSDHTGSHVKDAQDAWKKMLDDHLARVEALEEQTARAEAQAAERTREAIDEVARMSKETLAYAGQLSAEWRKLCL